jgi:hypothetical protein
MTYQIGYDIAGEDDDMVMGDDDEIGAIVAAVRRRMAAKRPMMRSTPKGMVRTMPTGVKTPYGQPVVAKEREIDASLYQVFGLGSVTVAVAGAAALSQPFIEKFKPGRLVLGETAVVNLVTGIFVGIRPQGANLASLPVSAFAGGNNEVRVAFDAGEIGQNFTINLLTTAAAQTLSGMAFGTTIKAV